MRAAEHHRYENFVNYPSEKFCLRRQRPSVRTDSPGSGSRSEFLPYPLESFSPSCFKMIEKSESVNSANVWWTLGADYLTFAGVMGDFRKKDHPDWFREEKKACKEIPVKNNILQWKKYHSWRIMLKKKKILHPLYVGENVSNSSGSRKKNITSTKSPIPGAHQMEPPSPLISWVNPFLSRVDF